VDIKLEREDWVALKHTIHRLLMEFSDGDTDSIDTVDKIIDAFEEFCSLNFLIRKEEK